MLIFIIINFLNKSFFFSFRWGDNFSFKFFFGSIIVIDYKSCWFFNLKILILFNIEF